MVNRSVAPPHYNTRSEERQLTWQPKLDKLALRVVLTPKYNRRNARGSKAKARSKYSIYQDAIASIDNPTSQQDTTNMGLLDSSYLGSCLPSKDSSDSRSIDELCTEYQNNQETIHSANSADNNNLNNIDSADSADEQNKHNVVELNDYRKTRGQDGMSKRESESINYGVEIYSQRANENGAYLLFTTIGVPSGFVDPINKTPDGKDLLGELFTLRDYLCFLRKESDIAKSIKRAFQRILKKLNLPEDMIIVKEPGVERFNNHGQLTIHYHIVTFWKYIAPDDYEKFKRELEYSIGTVYYNALPQSRKKGKKVYTGACRNNEVWKNNQSDSKGFDKKAQKRAKEMKKYLTKNRMREYLTKNDNKKAEHINSFWDNIKNSPYANTLPRAWIMLDDDLKKEIKVWKERYIKRYDTDEKTKSEILADFLYYKEYFQPEPYFHYSDDGEGILVAIIFNIKPGKLEEVEEMLSSEYHLSSKDPSHKLKRYSRAWKNKFEYADMDRIMGNGSNHIDWEV